MPELVVFSVKRVETNKLTPEMLKDVIATRRPGQVLLKRSHAAPSLLEYLDTSDVRVGRRSLHYARPDVADNTSG